jgi:hypothetical protein
VALVRTDVSEEPSASSLGSSETPILTRAIRRNTPEDTILHSHRRENLKSYTYTATVIYFHSVLETTGMNQANLQTSITFCTGHHHKLMLRCRNPTVKMLTGIRFWVFTAVTMKNAVTWDTMPCGSCKNRRFGGTYLLHHQDDKNRRARNNVSSN